MEKAKGAVTESNFFIKTDFTFMRKLFCFKKRRIYYLLLLKNNIKHNIDDILQNF